MNLFSLDKQRSFKTVTTMELCFTDFHKAVVMTCTFFRKNNHT